MPDLKRNASAEWKGDLRGGSGTINTTSGVLKNASYSFTTRFENTPGTNPEELVAAAHAACFSMAFANELAKKGFTPESVRTNATLTMTPKEGGGWRINKVMLDTQARVPGIDEKTFQESAEAARKGCPISVLLAPGLEEIGLKAKLA